ncbi:MAG: hypothetical protein LQ338_005030 [Usnochroma carphineum]|nr:MAG: hypothetical protein LQ338_005030 [Usnochroma carphineum]
MSGIEVAGIALAVFPILVNGLHHMVAGIETIKRWRRYKLKLEEYATILESAEVYFFDTLDELLNDIVPSDEELELLIREPLGTLWRTPRYDKKLHERLDRSYKSYSRTIQTLVDKLNTMCDKLGIDKSGTIKWDSYSAVEREMKRVKLTFSRSVYKEILDDISQANKDLREFTHQNIALEPLKRKRRSRRPIAELKLIRQQVASLYQALMTEKAWKCDCKTYHMASLRLEARPRTAREVRADMPQEHVFRVLLSVADDKNESHARTQWREIEVIPSLKSQIPIQGSHMSPAVQSAEVRSAVRGVRFASDIDASLTERPKEASSGEINWISIEDLCSAIRAPSNDKKEIGFLVGGTSNEHQHKLYRATTIVGSQPLSRSLEDLLRSQRDMGDGYLSRRARLEIAVTLASSVLQLDGSSWLKSGWSSGDIFFHYRDCQLPFLDDAYPYLSWQHCCHEVVPSMEELRLTNHWMRCDALLALGLTLVELCFGRTLAEMRKLEDLHSTETATRLKTATRLHSRVYNEMGLPYGDVVRRCLFQLIDVRELNLEIEEVQQKVFDDIVTPLVEDLKNFDTDLRIITS